RSLFRSVQRGRTSRRQSNGRVGASAVLRSRGGILVGLGKLFMINHPQSKIDHYKSRPNPTAARGQDDGGTVTTAANRLTINLDRLRADIDEVNRIGQIDGVPGINRVSFSDADMAWRRWVMERLSEGGLRAKMEPVGKDRGVWCAGTGRAVQAGSHPNAVPQGGRFDGTLGVCAALEAERSMKESGLEPLRPIEVVCTADEEGRFGGMLGSQA